MPFTSVRYHYLKTQNVAIFKFCENDLARKAVHDEHQNDFECPRCLSAEFAHGSIHTRIFLPFIDPTKLFWEQTDLPRTLHGSKEHIGQICIQFAIVPPKLEAILQSTLREPSLQGLSLHSNGHARVHTEPAPVAIFEHSLQSRQGLIVDLQRFQESLYCLPQLRKSYTTFQNKLDQTLAPHIAALESALFYN